jgi:hypothetical protein
MARIRTVKPEFWSSEQVMECSPIARLLFIGLWNFCDDGGNHVDSDRTIKAEIFPGDDVSSVDVRRMLDELSANNLICFYTSDSKAYLHVNGWKHQKIDRPSFKHPAFPGDLSPIDRRTVVDNSPPEGKGREGKGEEGKEASSLRSESSAPLVLTPAKPTELRVSREARITQIATEAQAAYNAILAKPNGNLSACAVLNKPRVKAVEKALPTARQMCQRLYGNERVTAAFWTLYFEEVERDDFHAGRQQGGPGHENWKPDFEYLIRENVMAKLFDRAITEAAA